jgi:hypothetical protein
MAKEKKLYAEKGFQNPEYRKSTRGYYFEKIEGVNI